MSELPVGSGAVTNNQHIVTMHELDEDTDSPVEDDDQDTASGLDDEHEEEIDSAGVERAAVSTNQAVQKDNDDDDFRPVKKRKVQESNDGGEPDEVMECDITMLFHINM